MPDQARLDALDQLSRESIRSGKSRHDDGPEVEREHLQKHMRGVFGALRKPAGFMELFCRETGLPWDTIVRLMGKVEELTLDELRRIETFVRRVRAGAFDPPEDGEAPPPHREAEGPPPAQAADDDLGERNQRKPRTERKPTMNETDRKWNKLCDRWQALDKPQGFIGRFMVAAGVSSNVVISLKKRKAPSDYDGKWARIEKALDLAEAGKLKGAAARPVVQTDGADDGTTGQLVRLRALFVTAIERIDGLLERTKAIDEEMKQLEGMLNLTE